MPSKSYIKMNANDALGRVEIYDAASFGFDKVTYNARFSFNIGSGIPPIDLPCKYDLRSDRLYVDTKEAPNNV